MMNVFENVRFEDVSDEVLANEFANERIYRVEVGFRDLSMRSYPNCTQQEARMTADSAMVDDEVAYVDIVCDDYEVITWA